jgi:hypothetical protein
LATKKKESKQKKMKKIESRRMDALDELGSLEQRLREASDPFSELDALVSGRGAPSAVLDDLFAQIETSASSLATIVTGFFVEEYGVKDLSPDKTLDALGLDAAAVKNLEDFLVERVDKKLLGCTAAITTASTFNALCADVDKASRKQGVEVKLEEILQPVAAEALPAPQRTVATDPSSTPKTRRKNAVEKGIRAFQGMTLRGRTPEQQSQQQKRTSKGNVVRSNVLL